MKLALLADIHGNVEALRAVLADMPSVDRLIVAGDVVGYYPFFEECIAELDHAGAECIIGNHEAYRLKILEEPQHEILRQYARFFFDHAGPAIMTWLRALPLHLDFLADDIHVKVCHGTPWSISEYAYPEKISADGFSGVKADVVVLGHTHRPVDLTIDGLRLLNPGSVGQPRDGDPRASYCLFDTAGPHAEFRRVSYAASRLIEFMKDNQSDPRLFQYLPLPDVGREDAHATPIR